MENVSQNDISRLDALYHKLLKENIDTESKLPKELKEYNSVDISVINMVAVKPDIIIREIAENLKIPNSTLTSSINRLEDKGMIKRVISRKDRRSFSLELTEKGLDVQKVHLGFEHAYFTNILSRLETHNERKALLDLVEKIVNSDQNEIRNE